MPVTSFPEIQTIADIVKALTNCSNSEANAAELVIRRKPSSIKYLLTACNLAQASVGFGGVITVGTGPTEIGPIIRLAIMGAGGLAARKYCRAVLFTVLEAAIVEEAKAIVQSEEMSTIRAAHAAKEGVTVQIGGRMIQYEPNLSSSGMTLFGENGFLIGREAFSSEAEIRKTLLHELFRLYTSESAGGVSAALAKAETDAAFNFAEKSYHLLF